MMVSILNNIFSFTCNKQIISANSSCSHVHEHTTTNMVPAFQIEETDRLQFKISRSLNVCLLYLIFFLSRFCFVVLNVKDIMKT